MLFQSTPSAWRETHFQKPGFDRHEISIHSLRMEGDLSVVLLFFHRTNFNPLPPHGGRHSEESRLDLDANFNPLPPHGGRQ